MKLYKLFYVSRRSNTEMMKLKNYIFKAALICLFLTDLNLYAQDIFSPGQDLSKIRVENLSDAEIDNIRGEMKSRNLTLSDVEAVAYSKGMSPSQFAILSDRLQLGTQEELSISDNSKKEESKLREGTSVQTAKYQRIFGSEIFANKQLNFEPNQSMATPGSYVLGPGDELQIILYGMQQFQQVVRISKEGFVNIPNVGNIKLGGLQFGAGLELIKKKCSAIYSSLKSGGSELSVSVTKFKTIQVTIIGAQNPGNYNVSSLATVFNALHAAGGPGENGSFRNIELIRKGRIIKIIDLYSFLSRGDVSGNLNLENDDIIRVPPYIKRVEIEGEVKRPGIFELKDNENLRDLLTYCSGYTESAYEGAISITRLSERKKKIVSVDDSAYDTLKLESGDFIKIDPILDLYENRVIVKGALNHPGQYELTAGMRLSDLIRKADGLREDAFPERAILIRENQNMLKEVIGIDLRMINSGSFNDLLVQKEDELIVPSVFDYEEKRTIEINGEVLNSGTYPFFRKMKLYDLLNQAGGVTESAADIVEISRITNTDSTGLKIEAEILTLTIDRKLNSDSSNIELMPFDVVSVRKKSSYNMVNAVQVYGQVKYPGKYGIGEKNERVFSVIERAGGLNDKANPKGVKIVRIIEYVDTLDPTKTKLKEILVPLKYDKLARNPKHKSNITILPGDQIIVEQLVQTVKIVGEVQMNSEIPVQSGRRVKYYINSSGGYNENADKRRVYVVYANGLAKKTKRFLFFRISPKPENGSQVVVTKKEKKEKNSTGEIIGISSILSSMTGMTMALINLLK